VNAHLYQKNGELLKYFLDTNQKISNNKKIMAAVWGKGEHSFDALRSTVCKLNKLLPDDAQIKNSRLEGYVLDVTLEKVVTKYRKTELIFVRSPFVKKASIVTFVSFFYYRLLVWVPGLVLVNG
jgi:DNA-binding winged helix-turn-helix (wHTH) protein